MLLGLELKLLGEIVEMGTHKELLKNKEGQYRNLYDAQFLTKDS